MPSDHSTRRAFLATAASVGVTALAGCGRLPGSNLSGGPAGGPDLREHTLYLDKGVTVPGATTRTVSDPRAAELAVLGVGDGVRRRVTTALDAGTTVVVAGEDALGVLLDACVADGRSHGVTSRGWAPTTRVVAVTPSSERLTTHVFQHTALPESLPWVLETLLTGATGAAIAPRPPSAVSSAGGFTPVGTAHVRGRGGAGTYHRLDRLWVAPREGTLTAAIEVRATFLRAGGEDGYRPEEVRFALDPYPPGSDLRESDPEVEPRDEGTETTTTAVSEFDGETLTTTARPDEPVDSFTAHQRSVWTGLDPEASLEYVANVRFRWRADGVLSTGPGLDNADTGRRL